MPRFHLFKTAVTFVACTGEVTMYFMPIAMFMIASIRPCTPPNLIGIALLTGSPEQASLTCWNPSARLLTSIVESIVELHIATAGIFYAGMEAFLGIILLLVNE
jgi:hypothetical protein